MPASNSISGKNITPALSPGQWRWRRWRRKLLTGLFVAAVIAGLCIADRLGLFGLRRQNDLRRYHDKTFTVVHVVDGDTLDVAIADETHCHTRIRLWGVDTPETHKPDHPIEHFGPEASRFTKLIAHGQSVRLVLLPHKTRDTYGRLLAYVYLPDGKLLNRELITRGLGYADPRYQHRYYTEFKQLMKQAKADRIGLWKNPVEADTPYYLR